MQQTKNESMPSKYPIEFIQLALIGALLREQQQSTKVYIFPGLRQVGHYHNYRQILEGSWYKMIVWPLMQNFPCFAL